MNVEPLSLHERELLHMVVHRKGIDFLSKATGLTQEILAPAIDQGRLSEEHATILKKWIQERLST